MDTLRIKKEAARNVDTGLASLKRWWIRKYKLPPNHPLFLNQSIGELNLEMYEDWMLRRDDLETQMTKHGDKYTMDEYRGMQRELSELNALIDDRPSEPEDALADEWERDLAEGRVPDLTKGLNV